MVEPMSPEFREALKAAHEGLTDEVIDGIEELIHRRFQIDPEVRRKSIQDLDEERRQLIAQYAPRWKEVSAEFRKRRGR